MLLYRCRLAWTLYVTKIFRAAVFSNIIQNLPANRAWQTLSIAGIPAIQKTSSYQLKREIPIFPLMPKELNFHIGNKEFEQSLSQRMKEVKDVFVFGRTVASKVSKLLKLRQSNNHIINNQ